MEPFTINSFSYDFSVWAKRQRFKKFSSIQQEKANIAKTAIFYLLQESLSKETKDSLQSALQELNNNF